MKALIIDTSYLIYRSFFAYPHLTAKGVYTGAFFGFAKTILTLIQQYKPDELVFANDTTAPTWRHDVLADYKGNRPEIQEEMVQQIPLIKNWIKDITPNIFSQDGFEADDFIYTVSSQIAAGNNPNDQILIFSSDKDLYQILVEPQVFFLQTKTSKDGWKLFGQAEFIEKYGLDPKQWLDYKALTGDPSDNLKGVSGIGPKTATRILQEVGCLYNLFDTLGWDNDNLLSISILQNNARDFVENSKNESLINKIKSHKDILLQTYYLATLQSVPGTSLKKTGFDLTKGISSFYEFGFKSLINSTTKLAVEDAGSEALF
ncbi:MAG: 5'-3' exonuclease H3TH domain-containing protein [Patescibacteria group bacterium]